jgi:hypothetical protein
MAAEISEKNDDTMEETKEAKQSKPSIWPQVKKSSYIFIWVFEDSGVKFTKLFFIEILVT